MLAISITSKSNRLRSIAITDRNTLRGFGVGVGRATGVAGKGSKWTCLAYHLEKQKFKGLEFTCCRVDLQPQQLHGGDP